MINPFKQHQMPQQSFTHSIQLTNSMKALVSQTSCPACTQKTLQLMRSEQGTKAFETQVSCSNCHFTGISNSTGFQFNNVNSKGKATT
jgi:predicted RNA-binding Zn-ribbon protein involved in translation (DUF1610 family)